MQPKATVDKLQSQLECQFGVRVVYRSLCTAEGDSLEKETKLATLNTSTFYLKRDPRAIDITVHLPPGLFPAPLFFLYFFVPSVFSFFFVSRSSFFECLIIDTIKKGWKSSGRRDSLEYGLTAYTNQTSLKFLKDSIPYPFHLLSFSM